MNYDLSEEQQILKDAARGFILKECPRTYVREMAENQQGYNPQIWKKMADLGWMGLMFPEQYGGSGGSFLDLAVLLYEMGYGCLPGPFFSTVVLGGLTLLTAGNETQKRDLLPEAARGKQILSLALTEKSGTFSLGGISTRAEMQNGQYIISGTKLFVPDAHIADTLICTARTGGSPRGKEGDVGLFLVDRKSSGVAVQGLRTMDSAKQSEVIFDRVRIPKENLLGETNQGTSMLGKILGQAAVAKCAEMSGGAEKVIEFAVAHVKERVQFGRPVGSFQAIQHHLANMLTYWETSKFMTYQAAWRIAQGLPFEREASMCKAWVSESYRRLVALAHQAMGGMGFMEEHDLQLYFKQAKTAELAYGDADFHREMVAQQMGL